MQSEHNDYSTTHKPGSDPHVADQDRVHAESQDNARSHLNEVISKFRDEIETKYLNNWKQFNFNRRRDLVLNENKGPQSVGRQKFEQMNTEELRKFHGALKVTRVHLDDIANEQIT